MRKHVVLLVLVAFIIVIVTSFVKSISVPAEVTPYYAAVGGEIVNDEGCNSSSTNIILLGASIIVVLAIGYLFVRKRVSGK